MGHSYKEFKSFSDDKLIEIYDQLAKSSGYGISFLMDELHRRSIERQTEQIRSMTRQINNNSVNNNQCISCNISLPQTNK